MCAFYRNLMVFVAVWSIAACSDSGKSSSGKTLTLTATVNTGAVSTIQNGVKANGSNTVTISVTGATKAPITLRTARGTFTGGAKTATIDGLSGSADLTTCNASTDVTCAGSVKVTAVDANDPNFVAGSVTLNFIGYETICNDGKDNNGDGTIDCADSDCNQKACVSANNAAGTCDGTTCVVPVCVPTSATEICNNNVDDNCDGKIDCAQSSCDGQHCKSGNDNYVCQSSACTDVTSGYGLSVVPKRTRLPADGTATTTVTVTVTKDGTPQTGASLTLATDLAGSGFVVGGSPVQQTTVATGDDGTATVTFQASETAGVATITATLTGSPVSLSALITMPALGSIAVSSIQNPVMGVKYSGWNEQNQISVLLLDTEQKPYPDGLKVRFEHQQLGGSKISTPWTADTSSCTQANSCLGYLGQTTSPVDTPDTVGKAYVSLYSGTIAGLVSINVTATAGGATHDYTIQNIAIVGAKASGTHISLDCLPRNIPALIDHNCQNTFYDGAASPIVCTVYFADRFNNVLGKSVRATFASEAGSPGSPVSTLQYDPTKSQDQTKDLGFVANTIDVNGYSIPIDVAPIDDPNNYEPRHEYPSACGTLVHNPRDGLNTIIVMAQGEEGFVDLNGNGVWDAGEPFIDQGEPFVDANDNGIQDGQEFYLDLNSNGKWDGPNGVWDANTTIWTETRVLYTSLPHYYFGPQDPNDPVKVDVSAKVSASFGFLDDNYNPLAPTVTTYSVASELGNATAAIVHSPDTVDNVGMSFTLQYCAEPPGTPPANCSTGICQTVPCYLRTFLTNFSDISAGSISITGVTAGSDIIDVDPKVDYVKVSPGVQIPVTITKAQ